jgi:MoaA/NifB/PqqE/SkfB family radical SAM enzyme
LHLACPPNIIQTIFEPIYEIVYNSGLYNMIENIVSRSVNELAKNRLVHKAINSKTAYKLIDSCMTASFIRPMQNPTNDNILGCVRKLDKVAKFVIPDKKNRVLETRFVEKIIDELETSKISGTDTNLTKKIKRTLDLMGEKYLRTLIVDYGAIGCGVGNLNKRFKEEKHYIDQFSMEILSDCNAVPRCKNCYAASDKEELDYETQDRLMAESIAMGSRFSIVLGGEPLMKKAELLQLFRKYNRRPFMVATNGILLDETYAKEVAELGNVITLLDIPGLEATVGKVRGKTTASWSAIKRAAENLQKFGAASGFSAPVTQENFRDASSPEFVQQMIDFGMMLGFYFEYTDPMGCAPKTNLLLTPEMNEEFSQRVKYVSDNYPMILIDTSNEAEKKIGGCPAGRANLPYVKSDGTVKGCPLGSDSDNRFNIHSMSLGEILSDPYFELLRKERPSCVRDPNFQKKLTELNQK